MSEEGTMRERGMRDRVEQAKHDLIELGRDLEDADDGLEEHPHIIGVETLRKFPPLKAGHPLLEEVCSACGEPFVEGDVPTLITLGPGADPDERAKAAAGRSYNAIAAAVHWACATGEEL